MADEGDSEERKQRVASRVEGSVADIKTQIVLLEARFSAREPRPQRLRTKIEAKLGVDPPDTESKRGAKSWEGAWLLETLPREVRSIRHSN